MDSQPKPMQTATKYLTTAASIAASAMLARTILDDYLPSQLRSLFHSSLSNLLHRYSFDHTILIHESEGLSSNELFDASSSFLRSRISPSIPRLRAIQTLESHLISLSLDAGQSLIDSFLGADFKWRLFTQTNDSLTSSAEIRWFELTFHKKHKSLALDSYLPHILQQAKQIKAAEKMLKLYMNEYKSWIPIDLQHPATFETLAMEADLKKTIFEDLARFVKRKEYYKKIGKAWKRGYLLFGPPGTGKSSLIAAMANYLRFDIYDLDLKEIQTNSWLKRLLVGMTNKSLLVIEDIDCSIKLKRMDEEKKGGEDEVSLSVLLNFIDGLWSASGEERIIVFTTNYKERLDAALLRPGRMDMHVHMGYCGVSGFRVLAWNYHAVAEHELFGEIEGLLKEVEATPAEVAERLMRSDDVDVALEGLVQLLKGKRREGQGDERVAVGDVNCEGEGED